VSPSRSRSPSEPSSLDGRAPLSAAFFARPVLEVAPDLIGCVFLFGGLGGTLVEVEAYRSDDSASHSYRGPTPRNEVMFGPPGRLYVYFTMGRHFCCNIVCQPEGQGAGILLRALEPTVGVAVMRGRRGLQDRRALCSGPAKLTQALGISIEQNGLVVGCGETQVLSRPGLTAAEVDDPASWSRFAPVIEATPRIGISHALEKPWRFVDAGSEFLSRRLPAALRRG
jgi:DNA-3-methyladenine glycosylase